MKNQQALNIIRLFGGVKEIAAVNNWDLSRIYRWKTEGIPTKNMNVLIVAAADKEINLQANDFFNPSRLNAIFEEMDKNAGKKDDA